MNLPNKRLEGLGNSKIRGFCCCANTFDSQLSNAHLAVELENIGRENFDRSIANRQKRPVKNVVLYGKRLHKL